MAKINWVFQDESGTNLNRYIATNVETGEEIIFDLLRGGNISVVGTPLNAEKLNELVSAINSNYDSILSLQKNVSTNSTTIGKLQLDVSKNSNDISAINTSIIENNKNINGKINANSTAISNAQKDISQQGNSILSLQNYYIELQKKVSDNTSGISTNADEIESLKSRLDTLGFKEGTFSVGDISSDYILANKVIKQGKTCIFSLFLSTSFTTTLPEMVIPFPFEIVPKETINFTARGYDASSNIIVEKVIPMQISAGWGLLYIPPGYYEISFLNIGMEIQ